MPDSPPDVLLILRPVADPLAGPGVPPRDADYRLRQALKALLRGYGLKCIAVRNAPRDGAAVGGDKLDGPIPTEGTS